MKTFLTLFISLIILGNAGYSQSGSFGSIYALSGGQMAVFAQHNFQSGTGTINAGIVGGERNSPVGIYGWVPSSGGWVNASNNAFVDGYVTTYRTDAFTFPIGDNNVYRPAAVSIASMANPATAAYYAADPSVAITSNLAGGNYPALPSGAPFSRILKNSTLSGIDNVEYWDIDGNTPAKITLTWDVNSNVNALTGGNLGALTIAGWDGTQWVPVSSIVDVSQLLQTTSASSFTGTYSSVTSGSITTAASIVPSSYTVYTLAALTSTPLPLTIISFKGIQNGNDAALTWITANESNSSHFDIEYSNDGTAWVKVGTVQASGNTSVNTTYNFTHINGLVSGDNLYRLKMVDTDGNYKYSSIVNLKITASNQGIIKLYPNPATASASINLTGTYKGNATVYIINVAGQRVVNKQVVLNEGSNLINLPVQSISNGTYFVSIVTADGKKLGEAQQLIVSR